MAVVVLLNVLWIWFSASLFQYNLLFNLGRRIPEYEIVGFKVKKSYFEDVFLDRQNIWNTTIFITFCDTFTGSL